MPSQLAKDIAAKLNEEKSHAIRKIDLLIKLVGEDFVNSLLEETLSVEAQGGLMTVDGSRQRSSGGVFLYLAKGRVSPELRKRIFPFPKKKKNKAATKLLEQASENS